jgi:hypothetical protein
MGVCFPAPKAIAGHAAAESARNFRRFSMIALMIAVRAAKFHSSRYISSYFP